MSAATRTARVVCDPGILGGTPVLEGTRVPADTILAEMSHGTPEDEIRHHYPSVPPGALEACAAWAHAGRPANAPEPGFSRWWEIPQPTG